MMVALSIGAFVIAGVLSSYTFLGRNLIRYSNQQQLAAQIQRTLQIFAQDVHATTDVTSFSNTQLVLSLPYVHSDGSVTYYTVTHTYDSTAKTLTRTVAGTPPPDVTASALTLLTGVSVSGGSFFSCFDRCDVTATNTFGIKKIEIASFTLTAGTASAGTQTTYTAASARLILRNKHLILQQNGQRY
jgi:hypothetical protein